MCKKVILTILFSIAILVVAAAVAFAATPRGQLAWAVASLPGAADGALSAVEQQWAQVVPLDTTFESWSTVKLTGLNAPKLNDFSRKVMLAVQAQLDVCYDNATASGAAQISLTSGSIPMLGLSVYLSGDMLALQSSELLDKPVLIPVGHASPGTTLRQRLRGMTGTPVLAGARLALAATQALASVPAQDIATEHRQVMLLGQPRDCTAVTLRLQGDALAAVALPGLQAAARDEGLRQTLQALGAGAADGTLDAATGNPEAVRARLEQAQLTLTVLRYGLDIVGWQMYYQEPGSVWSVELIAYGRGGHADMRLTARGLGPDIDASLLRAPDGEGAPRLTAQATMGGTQWTLNVDGQGTALSVATGAGETLDVTLAAQAADQSPGSAPAFHAALPRYGMQLDGTVQRTATTGDAPDVSIPQWEESTSNVIRSPAQLVAALGKMGEKLRTLASSYGIKPSS